MTDEHEPYKPIACGLHSEYELAIMRRVCLHIGWVDDQGQQRIGRLWPVDLQTRAHVEYLIAKDADDQRHTIRLDRILQSNIKQVIQP